MPEARKLEMTAEAIVKDPAAYGIAFTRGPVEKNGKVFRNRPLASIVNFPLFRSVFTEYADDRLQASVKIASQDKARNTLSDAEVMLDNARMFLGERSSKPAAKWVATDGTRHATPEAARAASLADTMKQIKQA